MAGAYYSENQNLGTPTNQWLDYLQKEGVDWVGVSISMFSNSLADPAVYVRARAIGEPWIFEQTRTFSDDQLIGFTKAHHARGIRVYWTLAFDQPVFDAGLGDPRFAPNPRNCGTALYNVPRYFFGQSDAPSVNRCIRDTDWWWHPGHPAHSAMTSLFFDSMTSVAVHYAKLAQSVGVDMYSLGTETEQLWRTRATYAPTHFRSRLQGMVDAVRKEYTGVLTYDQHISAVRTPNAFGNEGYIPVFADLNLDVVGVSLYDDILTTQPSGVVGVPELTAGWLRIFTQEVGQMKSANGGRPVILTEFGLANGINGPWRQNLDLDQPTTLDLNGNGVFDGDEQLSNTLTAFAQAIDATNGAVLGGFLWGQPVFYAPPAARPLVDYMVYGRPQADAIGAAYSAWGARYPHFPEAKTFELVEYAHAGWNHYFLTGVLDEIDKLDRGIFAGWARTGLTFKGYPISGGTSPVCRFFSTSFGERSSHFYTPFAPECALVKANSSWQFEGNVFALAIPFANGTCPVGTIAVYRMYNNGKDGAPNHRYTTSLTVRNQMLAEGFIPEGAGVGVGFCAPQ
jgi:hypothetical protein